ncbi:MAG TPA: SusD/RagB family nutrient-binding outer membrane lipoprotein [Gemmatimonadaceae bacterium]
MNCKVQDFLDVNTSPNAPQSVTPGLYLPPMLDYLVSSPAIDGIQIGQYNQEFLYTSQPTVWSQMGYAKGSDAAAQMWRDVYWNFGQNLIDLMTKAEAEKRWDVLGVGYVLKAWGWQVLTDVHGEIIIKEAFTPGQFLFDYDTQEFAYGEVQRLLGLAIENLQKTSDGVDAGYLGRYDKIYNGDRTKWLKFAYGLQAINLSHFSNKATYKPADVIAAVDKSFASNADDALMPFPATQVSTDRSPYGSTRGNINNYRQSQFIVGLMNGTQLGSMVDPRMSRMLAVDSTGAYRGMDINATGFGTTDNKVKPWNLFGYYATPPAGSPSRYIFDDKTKFPNMTYAELQFIKAEAAYRAGDKATALTAYKNGISASFDFVNARNLDASSLASQITAAEKAAFLADPNIVPTSASSLTLTQIMSQKYVALWAWGHLEIWMDLRRYHYTDMDPASGKQVFPGYTPISILFGDNAGKLVQRLRPRYNSEYMWNLNALKAIGADALDWHTKPLWITQP